MEKRDHWKTYFLERWVKMKAWGFLAIATFKEGVRNKVFYNLFFFGLLIITASLILNQMTVGDAGKIIKDLGAKLYKYLRTSDCSFCGNKSGI